MSNKATAMIYGNGTVTKQYFIKPNSVTTKVTKGSYDILLFNGLMFSEENTNLDHVYFRNTHNIEEFEAFAEEGIENKRLTKADGEYIISNEMEILTAQRMTKEVEGEYQWANTNTSSRNGYPTYEDYIESEVKITPKQVSYYAQIVITLKNPNSIHAANGSLRGFMRSVRMSTGEPTHLEGTHQLRLNNMKYTDPDSEEYGTIESPKFVTFGPPLDMPNREYEFEVKIVLKDGNIVDEKFDITDQVEEAIDNIQTTKGTVINVPITLT
ncbi:DUF5119 domain-containing protein, partial [Bacteroides sp. OttesenSCG-928-M17]|nr:DUF5119 domain-containing protein [Bacteroides sp. OttesenSCG-928-M17]